MFARGGAAQRTTLTPPIQWRAPDGGSCWKNSSEASVDCFHAELRLRKGLAIVLLGGKTVAGSSLRRLISQ